MTNKEYDLLKNNVNTEDIIKYYIDNGNVTLEECFSDLKEKTINNQNFKKINEWYKGLDGKYFVIKTQYHTFLVFQFNYENLRSTVYFANECYEIKLTETSFLLNKANAFPIDNDVFKNPYYLNSSEFDNIATVKEIDEDTYNKISIYYVNEMLHAKDFVNKIID